MSFRIAMQARRTVSSLCRPHETIDQSYDYLIAQRQHGRDEQLFLSEAGPCAASEAQAPDDLQPRHVMIGTLVSRGPAAGAETFLLNRHIPQAARFHGLFLPADGFLRLTRSSVGLMIFGAARLSWAARTDNGFGSQAIARALSDVPNPVGCVLHIDAAYIPWSRESLPHDLVHQPFEGDYQ